MSKIKTLAIVGGISKGSLNRNLLSEIVKHNKSSLEFSTFEIGNLPFFSQELERNPPQVVTDFKRSVQEADAVLFITPEYNRSYPGVLKNAIDWCSRPLTNSLWKCKPVAVIGASPGKIGTFGAQQHLKNVCNFLDMRMMNAPEFYFDASTSMDENSFTPQTIDFVQHYLKKFEEWIRN